MTHSATRDTPGTPGSAPDTARRRGHPLGRLLRHPVAVVCLVLLALMVAASVCAPLLTSASPTRATLADAFAPPGGGHLLGADSVGRDVLARVLYGGRVSLLGGFIAVAVALLIGVPAGLLAGYYRGLLDTVVSWVASLVMAAPAIMVLLVSIAAIGPDTNATMAVLGIILAPGVFRLVRASVTSVREELYVDAARVSGLGDARIVRRHILPVVQAPTIIQAAQMFGVAVVIQAGIEFLGLGSAGQASWGAMLNDAFANLYTKPSLLVAPGLAIVITVAALGLLANALRDALLETGAPAARRPGRPRTARPGARPADGDDSLLAVENLRVTYPAHDGERTVVDGVSLTVRRGEVVGLVGESGSGKSQTAFAVLGLLPPEGRSEADRLSFDGRDLRGLGAKERNALRGCRIAYVPQEPMSNLDPAFRIGTQLVDPMRRHLKLSAREAREKALSLLERVGIPEPERVYHAYPHQISGGMAQRVLIAGAVSCDPDLLIADEPTTALDVTVQAEVLDLLRELQQERRMGLILVTHDFGVVADICDRVVVMRTGQVVETAPAGQLFADPHHEYTRMLLDSTLEDAPPRTPLRQAPATGTSLQEKV
ncbi:dipeptide/oligopeptide/nickel ABC transporter permease/ATP-binding protein [Streptomyces sp. 110]|uniref:Dipeptide/oligopeptide/nickel ABC transporter permease/ATP-binding protein n=1 Tax=Streptomyces endocoffeicus TaxID=2898945 RepID=A0ABS1PGH4_9ACTN|nr:dipeptide/oligopeptide/nickel ABC transporter permease/ATP-binding protein [Streptomyces endocoffeicus]MBL1111477.1 dipeptide/oligopeptide/nickel ABC transporter permease/ATP-binding protein [Streptomyces endocoffeicus]